MKVKLLTMTPDPIEVMWTAARTCYSAKGPIEIWEYSATTPTDKKWNLVKTVLDSGHKSVAENISFTFAIEGISRACSHQLTRHRAGVVFAQQSQRYVEIKESFDNISELFENPKTDKDEDYLYSVANKYFTNVTKDNYRMYIQCLISYLHGIKLGMKPEDARTFLPNATKTNLVMTINYRELIHVCNLRLCSRAQTEIRTLFSLIKQEVQTKFPELATLLVPNCVTDGFCKEHKSCGRKPTLDEVLNKKESENVL